MAVAALLLSALGLAVLVQDALVGSFGWGPVVAQLAGAGAGCAGFRWLTPRSLNRRATRRALLCVAALVCAPGVLALPLFVLRSRSPWGIDIAESLQTGVLGLGAVIVCAWSDVRPVTRFDRRGATWALLALVFIVGPFAFLVLLLRDVGVFLTIVVTTCLVLRGGGFRWRAALMPLVLVLGFVTWSMVSVDYRRVRLTTFVTRLVWERSALERRSLAGAMMRRREWIDQPASRWFFYGDLPPRAARDLAAARLVGDAGAAALVPVVLLFAYIARAGFDSARCEPPGGRRALVAGMSTLVVLPAALHIVGCVVLLNAQAGPLPFVSYGPGELVIDWLALGLVAGSLGDHPGSTRRGADCAVLFVEARG